MSGQLRRLPHAVVPDLHHRLHPPPGHPHILLRHRHPLLPGQHHPLSSAPQDVDSHNPVAFEVIDNPGNRLEIHFSRRIHRRHRRRNQTLKLYRFHFVGTNMRDSGRFPNDKELGLKTRPVIRLVHAPPPQRLGLPAQAAEIIKEMIENRELQHLLPGERTLAANLQIGRDTLRAALDALEAEQWIAPREHGKRRKILRSSGASPTGRPAATKRVALLSPKRL